MEDSSKSKDKVVSQGQLVEIDVRLINKSGGDIDEGMWTMILPPGVTFEKGSIALTSGPVPSDPTRTQVVLDGLDIYTGKALYFSITVRIGSVETGSSLVFRSFLNDFDAYCEAFSALTVRTHLPSKALPLPQ